MYTRVQSAVYSFAVGVLILGFGGSLLLESPLRSVSSQFLSAPDTLNFDPPVALCQLTLDVYLDGSGEVSLDAEAFDDGSYDSCSPIDFSVRRNGLDCNGQSDVFSSSVEFCCSDVTDDDLDVVLLVVDDIGNFDICFTQVTVIDTVPPDAYCVNGMVVEIPNNGIYEVNAADFDEGSQAMGCLGDLTFSFSEDPSDSISIITCDDICNPVLFIPIYVLNPSGTYSTCESFLIVQDNLNVCNNPCDVGIGGLVTTEEDNGIEDATVLINGGELEQVTDAVGSYYFSLTQGNNL